MTTYRELRGYAEVWPCQVSRAYMTDWEFQQGSFLADYAKAGKWAKVVEILHPDNHLVNVNQSWPGDSSRSAALHPAELLRPPPSPFDAGELAILDARHSEGEGRGKTVNHHDIIGDVHGCATKLEALRGSLPGEFHWRNYVPHDPSVVAPTASDETV